MAENEVYEVEQIIDQREVDGQLQFYVKWKNYNNDWNTWEPIDNLLDCFDLVLEFQEKTQSNPKKNPEKSKLARKEALKIVKKAKKLNSASENIKRALQKHAAIVNDQDVSLNLSIDTSVHLDSSPSSAKSPKSPQNISTKSPKKAASLSPRALSGTEKRTPKKPLRLEEYYDPSKMFVKSSSTLNIEKNQSADGTENPSFLRTLLTTGFLKSNKTASTDSNDHQNRETSESASNKTGSSTKINVSSETKVKKKRLKNENEKKLKGPRKPQGVKTLKQANKTQKPKKKSGLMLVKMKPIIKKEKLDDSVFMSDQSLNEDSSVNTSCSVDKVESPKKLKSSTSSSGSPKKIKSSTSSNGSPKTKKPKLSVGSGQSPKKSKTSVGSDGSPVVKKVKKVVKKNPSSDQKDKSENEPKKKVKKISVKNSMDNSGKVTVKKQKDGGEKKITKKKISVKKEDKVLKRKYDAIEIIDTESDDGMEIRISPKAKKAKITISPKSGESIKNVEVPPKIEKELSKKTLQVKVKPMEHTSHTKKLQLIDTVKTKTSMPKSVVRPISPTPVFTSVKPIISNSRPIIPMETMCANVAATGYHYVPAMIPISPSSMSYKMLLDNLPFQYQPKKSSKKRDEDSMDDVERRMSVRQSECAYRYKEIVVKKCNKYTQIWLNTHTKLKNSLNPQVIQEIVAALNAAKYDDSNLVMFSGLGNVFCSGIDLTYLVTMDRKIAARKMVDALRDFMKALITFPKPLVAVVAGSAIGLGMTMLPLCDIVYASDKASFYLPYAQLCQTPEGCASYMLPNTVGMAMANELLIAGRKITAIEACQLGLVSQVFWPTSIMQEVIPRIENMALQSGKALETTKLLLRSHNRTKIELTNESECNLLLERWPSSECQKAIENYLSNDNNFCL